MLSLVPPPAPVVALLFCDVSNYLLLGKLEKATLLPLEAAGLLIQLLGNATPPIPALLLLLLPPMFIDCYLFT